MKSVLTVCDGDPIEDLYDLPGTRYWLQRVSVARFWVVGWAWNGQGWFIQMNRPLTGVLGACLDEGLSAKSMIDGGRSVISKVKKEAS